MTFRRRYPRIPVEASGELELGDAAQVPVRVRNLSCEGAGLEVPPDARLPAGGVVTLRFELDEGGPVTLSARVAWAGGKHAGLQLRLAETEASSKRAYGAWIVPRTKSALAGASS